MRVSGSFVLLLSVLAAGCGPPVDLTTGLQVENVSTGWFDAGIVEGKNKLVPTVTFALKDVSDQKLVVLQVQVVFHRVTEPTAEWGTGFLTAVGSEGLAPGAKVGPFTIKSPLGYTGTDPRDDMLHNSQFVDAEVDLLAKYASNQWKKIGEYPIERKLLTK